MSYRPDYSKLGVPASAFAQRALCSRCAVQRRILGMQNWILRRRLAYRRRRVCGSGRLAALFFAQPPIVAKLYMIECLAPGRHLNSPKMWRLVATIEAPDQESAVSIARRRYGSIHELRAVPVRPACY